MAGFGFAGNGGGGAFGSSAPGVRDLLELETEALGFHAIAGDAKVKLVQPWSPTELPPPTSSLLAIASKRGLVAAGGPTSVVIARTESVREAFTRPGGNIKDFKPELTLELGTRISQVAFSSNESVLVVSAELGGGLAVYEVDNLLKGNTNSTFEIGTSQTSVRALAPNPSPDSAGLFALVLADGKLLMADMASKQLSQSLHNNVSCVAWSTKGKQIVAGLSDGTIVQMTPTGDIKAQIPKPPGIEADRHVSAISWTQNDEFFVVHTPSAATDAMDAGSDFHIITREKGTSNCQFGKLPEVVGTFGLERFPANQYIQRLKDFPPDLKDVLMVASTASEDIKLVTRSGKALTSINDSAVIDVWTVTNIAKDSRRAAVPMTADFTNTSPIGMMLDLSSKTPVHRPLPEEEMDESSTPLPALLVLNNEGVLAGWWFTYADSIRNGTCYPGLVHAEQTPQPQQAPPSANPWALQPATGDIGSPSMLSGSSNFGQPAAAAKSTFGSAPTFGSASALGFSAQAAPSFGSSSMLGANRSSPWGSAGSFGKAQFGAASALGSKTGSPWDQPGTGNRPTTAGTGIFGQASSPAAGNTFGSGASPGNGFAGFAGASGFAAAASKPNIFASQTPSNTFGAPSTGSAFGTPAETPNIFGNLANKTTTPATSSIFGSTPATTSAPKGGLFGGEFKLGSAWKNDNPQKPSQQSQQPGESLFGNGFGSALGDAARQSTQDKIPEADMEDDVVESIEKADSPDDSRTQETTSLAEESASKFVTVPPTGSGLFGTQAQQKITPAVVQTSTPAPIFGSTPLITTESPTDEPLPPDTTSKATFTPATSSAASTDSITKPTPEVGQLKTSKLSFAQQASPASPEATESASSTNSPEVKSKVAPTVSKPTWSFGNVQEKAKSPTPAPSIFAYAKSDYKPSSDPQKPFFSAEPDEGEFGSTDETEGGDDDYEAEEGEVEETGDEADEEPEDEDTGEQEDEEDEEGSGVDVANELVTKNGKSAESSFGRQSSGLTDRSWSNIKASPQKTPPSTRKGGLFDRVTFPPRQPDNERSPSPERRVPPGLLRAEASRSVSAPNVVRKKTNLPKSMKAVSKPTVSFEHRQEQERRRRIAEAAEQRAKEEEPLEEDEDATVQRLLESQIEPTTELDAFIAHQDYAAQVSKVGIPGQIERLYRDINSMIDTIGLNCRSIQAFTAGHEEGFKDGRELDDLKDPKQWTLVEVEDLSKLETDLQRTAEQAQLRNVQDKLNAIEKLKTDLTKLSAHQKEVKALAESHLSADSEEHRDLDLSPDQKVQKEELRAKFRDFSTALTDVESSLALLSSKLAASNKNRNGTGPQMPTAEKVEETIRKMTKLAEQRSSDVDFLESQMRKLGVRSATPSMSRGGSREGSPFMSPSRSTTRNNRASFLATSTGNINGSPLRNGWRASTASGLGDSITSYTSNVAPNGLSRPKKISEYSEEDLEPFRRRAQKKREVMGYLRNAVCGKNNDREIKVVPLE